MSVPCVVVLPLLEHLDVVGLQEQLLVLHDEQRAADTAGISVDPNLSFTDVTNHGHL